MVFKKPWGCDMQQDVTIISLTDLWGMGGRELFNWFLCFHELLMQYGC